MVDGREGVGLRENYKRIEGSTGNIFGAFFFCRGEQRNGMGAGRENGVKGRFSWAERSESMCVLAGMTQWED